MLIKFQCFRFRSTSCYDEFDGTTRTENFATFLPEKKKKLSLINDTSRIDKTFTQTAKTRTETSGRKLIDEAKFCCFSGECCSDECSGCHEEVYRSRRFSSGNEGLSYGNNRYAKSTHKTNKFRTLQPHCEPHIDACRNVIAEKQMRPNFFDQNLKTDHIQNNFFNQNLNIQNCFDQNLKTDHNQNTQPDVFSRVNNYRSLGYIVPNFNNNNSINNVPNFNHSNSIDNVPNFNHSNSIDNDCYFGLKQSYNKTPSVPSPDQSYQNVPSPGLQLRFDDPNPLHSIRSNGANLSPSSMYDADLYLKPKSCM